MHPRPSDQAVAISSDPALSVGGPRSLAVHLAGDMAERWRAGQRPRAEDYLEQHPELRDHPEAAAAATPRITYSHAQHLEMDRLGQCRRRLGSG